MLQERPDGDAGGGNLRREQEHDQPLLQPAAQGDPQREHPRGRRVRAGRVVLRREAAGKTLAVRAVLDIVRDISAQSFHCDCPSSLNKYGCHPMDCLSESILIK